MKNIKPTPEQTLRELENFIYGRDLWPGKDQEVIEALRTAIKQRDMALEALANADSDLGCIEQVSTGFKDACMRARAAYRRIRKAVYTINGRQMDQTK